MLQYQYFGTSLVKNCCDLSILNSYLAELQTSDECLNALMKLDSWMNRTIETELPIPLPPSINRLLSESISFLNIGWVTE